MSKPNTSNPPGTPGRAPAHIPTTNANVPTGATGYTTVEPARGGMPPRPLPSGQLPAFPAPNAVENASNVRGQATIDAAEAAIRATRDRK